MINDIRFIILKIREVYNRKMWHYYIGQSKKMECNNQYRESYILLNKARKHEEIREYVTGRLRNLAKA